jgi:hypothetical protein
MESLQVFVQGALGGAAHDLTSVSPPLDQLAQVPAWAAREAAALQSVIAEGCVDP